MKPASQFGLALMSLLCSSIALAQSTTVLYNDRVVDIDQTLPDASDLWVTPEDLTRINDFELKPQGACLEDLCIPVLQDRDSELYVQRQGQDWFNVTELADMLQQAWIADYRDGVWSFGGMPVERRGFFESAEAPEFALPDREGNLVRLADFRGKQVLLVTWASW